MNPRFFNAQEEFREWLEMHHKTEKELIVGFFKVGCGKPTMTWSQSVDQALCFGWIDGLRKSIDSESYCIRFTPRRRTSVWSLVNIEKIKELNKRGLMTLEGQKAYDSRTENSSRIYAYQKEQVELPSSYEILFKSNKPAWDFFNQQAPSYKKTMIHWIMGAKQESTRLSRLEKTIDISEQLKRMR